VLEVDLEVALEQPSQLMRTGPGVCAAWLSGGELRRVGILVGTCRGTTSARSLGVGRQHPMKADQVQPRRLKVTVQQLQGAGGTLWFPDSATK